jgi:hypothetical protein
LAHRPVYTTREVALLEDEAARITVDIFLHAGGRVTDWMGRVRPGNEITITGPGGGGRPGAPWMALTGDETAVPVIARILAEADPATRGGVILFVPENGDDPARHLSRARDPGARPLSVLRLGLLERRGMRVGLPGALLRWRTSPRAPPSLGEARDRGASAPLYVPKAPQWVVVLDASFAFGIGLDVVLSFVAAPAPE